MAIFSAGLSYCWREIHLFFFLFFSWPFIDRFLCERDLSSSSSTLTHTTLAPAVAHTLTHTHTHAHSRTLTHTHAHSRTLTHSHAQSRTVTHSHAQSRTVTHSHAQSRTVTHSHAQSRTVSHAQSRTVTHSHAQSRTVTHSHAQSRTVTHSHAHSRTLTHTHAVLGHESALAHNGSNVYTPAQTRRAVEAAQFPVTDVNLRPLFYPLQIHSPFCASRAVFCRVHRRRFQTLLAGDGGKKKKKNVLFPRPESSGPTSPAAPRSTGPDRCETADGVRGPPGGAPLLGARRRNAHGWTALKALEEDQPKTAARSDYLHYHPHSSCVCSRKPHDCSRALL